MEPIKPLLSTVQFRSTALFGATNLPLVVEDHLCVDFDVFLQGSLRQSCFCHDLILFVCEALVTTSTLSQRQGRAPPSSDYMTAASKQVSQFQYLLQGAALTTMKAAMLVSCPSKGYVNRALGSEGGRVLHDDDNKDDGTCMTP